MIKKVQRFKCSYRHLHKSAISARQCNRRLRRRQRRVQKTSSLTETCTVLAFAVVVGRLCGIKPSDMAMMIAASFLKDGAPASQKENDSLRGPSLNGS